jgi:hypothetical protein
VGETHSTHAGCEKFTAILIRTPERNRYTRQGFIKTEQKHAEYERVMEILLAQDNGLLAHACAHECSGKSQVTITFRRNSVLTIKQTDT